MNFKHLANFSLFPAKIREKTPYFLSKSNRFCHINAVFFLSIRLGSGGSILGIGNDIGGSVRNPAIFNGIYSLKPTHGRHLSQQGVCTEAIR